MQKVIKSLAFCIASTAFFVNGHCAETSTNTSTTSPQQSSVLTVDALLKIDNASAVNKAKSDSANLAGVPSAEASSLAKQIKRISDEKPVPVIRVDAISGIANKLEFKLNVNGENVIGKIGSVYSGCVITEVQNRCLIINPLPSEEVISGKNKPAKNIKRANCPPAACWTGVVPPSVSPGQIAQSGVIPVPMPKGNP